MPNKGTTHAYKVSRESDKITPGTSTVAKFKTLIYGGCKIPVCPKQSAV